MVNQYEFVNIRVILDKVLDHPLLSDITLERAIQYVVEFIGLMGLPSSYIDKIDTIEIKDYKGMLPCDLISINQVKSKEKEVCLRSILDTFNSDKEYAFKIQGRIIHTTIKDDILEISYKAIATDEEGLPLIPDEPTFLRALELYIKKKWFTILFDTGKISPTVLQNTQQEYAWAAGACNNTFTIPSVSEMETITNMMNRIIPKNNEFIKGFKNTGNKEYLKKY